MTSQESRQALVQEALTWLGTPYHASGQVKGAGTNCAQFIYGAAKNAGVFPSGTPEPRWYTPQLATHTRDERLIGYLHSYGAREIAEDAVQPGDVVVYRSGQAHGHIALIVSWPTIIHALAPAGCQLGNVADGQLGRMARKYFSFWSD